MSQAMQPPPSEKERQRIQRLIEQQERRRFAEGCCSEGKRWSTTVIRRAVADLRDVPPVCYPTRAQYRQAQALAEALAALAALADQIEQTDPDEEQITAEAQSNPGPYPYCLSEVEYPLPDEALER